jgi:hypothetical protein
MVGEGGILRPAEKNLRSAEGKYLGVGEKAISHSFSRNESREQL